MKSNIQKVKYNESSKEAEWWSYKMICDECNNIIYEFGDMLTSESPNINKNDYCLNCAREIIDKKIQEKERYYEPI